MVKFGLLWSLLYGKENDGRGAISTRGLVKDERNCASSDNVNKKSRENGFFSSSQALANEDFVVEAIPVPHSSASID